MKNGLVVQCLVVIIACSNAVGTDEYAVTSAGLEVPPIETLLLPPVELEHISLWVPAAKFGPEVNWSCQAKTGNSHSVALSSAVDHTKTDSCPEGLARMLAEYTAGYHQQGMPLTILGIWRWEYFYSPCQFDSVSFDLPKHGGALEGSWEAILTQSTGTIGSQWARLSEARDYFTVSNEDEADCRIKTTDFSDMRNRYGYPKVQKYHNK
jgi:hypothetical protein